jgi:hypothetical protein
VLFTPAWFVRHYDAWLERLANNRHEEYQLIDQTKQSEAVIQTLRSALERIAQHNHDRFIWNDGVPERQASPQEIADDALASISSSHNSSPEPKTTATKEPELE